MPTDTEIKPIAMLIRYALDQTAKGNQFFFNYSAHVDTFDIRGYSGEWSIHKEPVEGFSCRVSQIDEKKAENWITTFEEKLK